WHVAHYEGGAWKSVSNAEAKLLWFYPSYGPWKDGKTIALRVDAIPDQGMDEDAWAKLEKVLEKTTPRFEVPGQKPDPSLPTFAAGAHPTSFASLSSGDVVALVDFVTGDKTETKVQRWTDADTKGLVEALPGLTSALAMPVVAMSSATSAWVGGNDDGHAYLAHFDGKTWAKDDTAVRGVIASIAEGADGTTWVIAAPAEGNEGGHGEVWKAPKGGKLARIALPKTTFPADATPQLYLDTVSGAPIWKKTEPDADAGKKEWFLAPRQVVVSASGEPFVMAIVTDDPDSSPPLSPTFPALRAVILRTRGVGAPLVLPARATLAAEFEEHDSPPLAAARKAQGQDYCSHFFVLTGDVPEGAAADFDPKELRAALATVKAPVDEAAAYEVQLEGKRRLGVYVPMCPDDECKKSLDDLVAALTKKLPAKPTLYCRTPVAVRDLDVTFAK
ncbi:MAG: hypothetical protein ABI175_06485, partial [Polyangiales bacterium]